MAKSDKDKIHLLSTYVKSITGIKFDIKVIKELGELIKDLMLIKNKELKEEKDELQLQPDKSKRESITGSE